MMKDRYQKQKLLQYFLSRQWYPQMEVEIFAPHSPSGKNKMITDIDVMALASSQTGLLRPVLGDCKTLRSQSPINRAFWLKGIMSYLGADYGIILLSKKIESDHKLLASSLNVNLLSDDDFKHFADSMTPKLISSAALCNLMNWDKYFDIPTSMPPLVPLYDYCRRSFWNEKDATIRLRHSIARMQNVRVEMNPQNPICAFMFLELCSLFSIALCDVCIGTFEKFLWTESKDVFESDLRIQIWGGFENYQFWDQLRRKLLAKTPDEPVASLTLPEWPSFVQLVRACLDCPMELSITPIIIKELAFQYLQEQAQEQAVQVSLENSQSYLKELVCSHPQAAKCAILIIEYISKSARLPFEFSVNTINQIMRLQR